VAECPPPPAGTWTAEDAASWLAMADQREHALAPVLDSLLPAAALRPSEHVLDVGCGTGPTTAAAAAAVAPAGSVTAIDLAPELVAEARRRVPAPNIDWLVGDATTHRFPDAAFDVVISRFGVMFFADPYAAFRNFWRATRLGGRLAIAVWPPRAENEYFALPLAAVCRVLDRCGEGYDPVPDNRGPFAFGDPGFVTELLNRTGWIAVDVATVDAELPIGQPGATATDVAEDAVRSGWSRELLAGRPPEVRRAAVEEIAAALADRETPTGVRLTGRYRIVTAAR